jgi:2-C-methyl-D-erythritol 4-phosphate cytidylyltransferase
MPVILESLASIMPDSTPPPSPTMPQPGRLFVLIPCAGVGSRALRPDAPVLPKQYQRLCGQPLLIHTLKVFESLAPWSVAIAVVVAPQDKLIDGLLQGRSVQVLRCGGATRADTVRQGLQDWQGLPGGPGADDWVLVHDAARCLLEPVQVRRLVDRCWGDAVGGLLALPLPDTLKSEHQSEHPSELKGRVAQTLERGGKWLAQTPQMFRVAALVQALQAAQAQGLSITDESSAMEAQGQSPLLVAGSAQNFKITYPEDFSLAQAVLESRQRPSEGPSP